MTHRLRVAALAVFAALAVAAAATAHDVFPTQGETSLTLTKAAADGFAAAGVTATVPESFPIEVGGKFSFHEIDDPDAGGVLPHTGEIVLTKGDTTLRLANPTVTVEGGKNPTGAVSFQIKNARVEVARLDMSRYEPTEEGSAGFGGAEALLTQGAADALNAAFATTVFRAGLDLGEVSTTDVAQPVAFGGLGGATRATLSKGALTVLAENDVLVKPTGKATARGRSVTFPIVGGKLDVVSFEGAIKHTGGLKFGAYRTGSYSLAYEGDRGFVVRSGLQKGLALFTVRFAKNTEFGTEDAITVGKGKLYFAIEAARDIAPLIGTSAKKLTAKPIGTIDVDAPYSSPVGR